MKNPLAALFGPPKDDSPEAVLDGNLDEIPESEKVEEPVEVEEIGDED